MTDPIRPPHKPPAKKSEMLEVRLTYETKQSFLAACRTAGRTASDVVREQIEGFIAGQAAPVAEPAQDAKPAANILAFIPKSARKPGLVLGAASALGLAAFLALPSAAAPDLKSAFTRMDANKDGVLTADEFAAAPSGDAKQVTIRPMKKLPPGTTVPHLPVAGEKQMLFVLPHSDTPPQLQTATHQSFEPKQAPTMEAVRRAAFGLTDADGDGKVSLAEYMARQTAALANGFEHLDANKDGALSGEEYAKLNQTMMSWPVDMDVRYPTTVKVGPMVSDEAVTANFAKLDTNHDGKVSLEEYLPR
jgi:Ca2+-binding EF-hand superfamily protein